MLLYISNLKFRWAALGSRYISKSLIISGCCGFINSGCLSIKTINVREILLSIGVYATRYIMALPQLVVILGLELNTAPLA